MTRNETIRAALPLLTTRAATLAALFCEHVSGCTHKNDGTGDLDHRPDCIALRAELTLTHTTGTGCLGKAKGDEPVFVLRAQDAVAAMVVREWVRHAQRYGVALHTPKSDGALQVAADMDAWGKRNDIKSPD